MLDSKKKRRKDSFEKDSRTDKSITTEEVININPPPSNARVYIPYECNKIRIIVF